MKKTYILLLLILTIATQAVAQERSVQNKPYIDLRPLHFGVLVGTIVTCSEFLTASKIYNQIVEASQ